jgi:hypothetical protein
MTAFVRGLLVVGCLTGCALLAGGIAGGADVVPWAGDFRTACGLAAEQHRLVLLHFTTDNCPPCRKVEQEVFSQAAVGEAIGRNYVPVLVHAVKNPELATRYQVKHFPTDVIVTPSGLEIYRAISPQKPADYIGLLHRVAGQTGVGNSRNWAMAMGPAAQQAASAVNDTAQQSTSAATGAAGQFAAGLQDQAALGAERWSQAVQQFAAASDQARSAAQQAAEQAASAARASQQQVVGAAEELHQQAAVVANSAEQQVAATTQQFQQQSAAASQQAQQQVHDFRQQWQVTTQQTTAAARGATQQAADTARSTAQTWQQSLSAMQNDLRSSFVPGGGAPPPPSAASSAVPPPVHQAPPAAAAPPLVSHQPQMPTENPWVGTARSASAPPPSQTPQPEAAPTNQRQTIAASQAPPIAIDGYCIVSLLEDFQWKKADPRFGAIHRGRTYLFVGGAEQQRFLMNPDAFAPVLSGCDPVRFARTGELVQGKRAYGLLTPDRRIFLFADLQAMEQFQRSPSEFAAAAYQAMQRNDTGNLYR